MTEANPTHHISECAATREIGPDDRLGFGIRWYHMCRLPAGHAEVHACGECEAKWSDI